MSGQSKSEFAHVSQDGRQISSLPCRGAGLAGTRLPGFRIHAGCSFSFTAKPARFLASAACMTSQRPLAREQAVPGSSIAVAASGHVSARALGCSP